MPLHLIIDGYNLIRQSADLKALDRQAIEFGRDALIDKLVAYRRIKRHKITLVFDGSAKYFFPGAETSWKGVNIKFSRHGESADSVIKKMARQDREKAIVVSSDTEVSDFAALQGAIAIPSDEFEEKLLMAEMMEAGDSGEGAGTVSRRVIGTKKKGPARKLPKNRRRIQQKTKKL